MVKTADSLNERFRIVRESTRTVPREREERDDLRALALRRATAVQVSVPKAAPGAASRLFLVAPRLGSGGGHVELKLKQN